MRRDRLEAKNEVRVARWGPGRARQVVVTEGVMVRRSSVLGTIVRLTLFGLLSATVTLVFLPGRAEAYQADATPTPQTVTVAADQRWTDTGIDVQAGAAVQIVGSGTIQTSAGNPSQSPGGNPDCAPTPGFTAPASPCYILVGQIRGGQDEPQRVDYAAYLHSGTCASRVEPSLATLSNLAAPAALIQIGNGVSFRAPAGGRLFMGVNDDYFEDNSGAWSASVVVTPSSEPLPGGDVAASVTNLATSLDSLLTAPHALAIWDASGTLVACGEITGTRRPEDRGVAIGLRPVAGSEFGGIGYLAPNPTNPVQTSVSLFLAPNLVATPVA